LTITETTGMAVPLSTASLLGGLLYLVIIGSISLLYIYVAKVTRNQ
jgi:hypothetical protein